MESAVVQARQEISVLRRMNKKAVNSKDEAKVHQILEHFSPVENVKILSHTVKNIYAYVL